MNKVEFRYSRSEVVAYLLTKGYEYSNLEVKKNGRYINEYKVFFVFEGCKDELIKCQQEFENMSNLNICLKDYYNNLIKIKKIISNKLKDVKKI